VTDLEGYGYDTYCIGGLQPGRIVSGLWCLAQDLFHRAKTTRGTLQGGPEESRAGLNVEDMIGSVSTSLLVKMLPGQLAAEWRKDDRVQSVVVKVDETRASDGMVSLAIRATVKAHNANQPFAMTMQLTRESGLALIGVNV